MKREWTEEELIEHFTLTREEEILLKGKHIYNQLGLAVHLKFFGYMGRFPASKHEICQQILDYLSDQIGTEANQYEGYDWQGRTFAEDRKIIRDYFGFREATLADKEELAAWLFEHPEMKQACALNYWLEKAYAYFQGSQVEPLTADQMERVVRSAIKKYEDAVCERIWTRLSSTSCQILDRLLLPMEVSNEILSNPWSQLAHLKTEPGGANLASILQETDKLKQLRAVELPANLFSHVDPKRIERYCQRAIAESPSDLTRHPDAIKYTLLAAFCVIRQAEITDNLVELLIQIIHKMDIRAEYRIKKALGRDLPYVHGKSALLYKIAEALVENPTGIIEEVVFPIVSAKTLQNLLEEKRHASPTYQQEVYQVMRNSYSRHYRRLLGAVLNTLEFRSNNTVYQPVIAHC